MKHCAQCRHWHTPPAGTPWRITDGTIGQCRAIPPAQDFRWPRTKSTDTCSAWSAVASAAATTKPPEPEPLPTAEFVGFDTPKKPKAKQKGSA